MVDAVLCTLVNTASRSAETSRSPPKLVLQDAGMPGCRSRFWLFFDIRGPPESYVLDPRRHFWRINARDEAYEGACVIPDLEIATRGCRILRRFADLLTFLLTPSYPSLFIIHFYLALFNDVPKAL